MDPDLAVADYIESNVPAPMQGTAPVESRSETHSWEMGLGKPFSI